MDKKKGENCSGNSCDPQFDKTEKSMKSQDFEARNAGSKNKSGYDNRGQNSNTSQNSNREQNKTEQRTR